MFQFISDGFGFGILGINARTKITIRNASDAIFIVRPHFPRLNFELRSGLFVQRRQVMQPIETM